MGLRAEGIESSTDCETSQKELNIGRRPQRLTGAHRKAGVGGAAGVSVGGVMLALLFLVGCSSTPNTQDPIERAKHITALRNSANQKIESFVKGFDRHTFSERAQNLSWNHNEITPFMAELESAEKDLREAVELASTRSVVLQLATVLQYESALLGLKFANLDARADSARSKGTWTDADGVQLEAARQEWADKVREANVQYRFFVERLIGTALPEERESALGSLYHNYRHLGEYKAAADTGRLILTGLDLSEQDRRFMQEQVQLLEELHLKDQLEQEERAARGS